MGAADMGAADMSVGDMSVGDMSVGDMSVGDINNRILCDMHGVLQYYNIKLLVIMMAHVQKNDNVRGIKLIVEENSLLIA